MPQPVPHPPAAAKLDQELAARAFEKLRAGQTPTAPETAALKRYEREREEKLRW